MRALGHVPELLPPFRRFGVEAWCLGVLAGMLGDLGAGGPQGVLVERVPRLEHIGEPLGEDRVASGKGGSHHARQVSPVVRGLPGPLELREDCARVVRRVRSERSGGRGVCHRDDVDRADYPRCLDKPVRLSARSLLAAGEAAFERDRA